MWLFTLCLSIFIDWCAIFLYVAPADELSEMDRKTYACIRSLINLFILQFIVLDIGADRAMKQMLFRILRFHPDPTSIDNSKSPHRFIQSRFLYVISASVVSYNIVDIIYMMIRYSLYNYSLANLLIYGFHHLCLVTGILLPMVTQSYYVLGIIGWICELSSIAFNIKLLIQYHPEILIDWFPWPMFHLFMKILYIVTFTIVRIMVNVAFYTCYNPKESKPINRIYQFVCICIGSFNVVAILTMWFNIT